MWREYRRIRYGRSRFCDCLYNNMKLSANNIYIIIILRRRARILAHTDAYYIDINEFESAVLLSICSKYILFFSVYAYTTSKRLYV